MCQTVIVNETQMFSNPGDDGGDDDGGDDGKTCTDNHSRCPEWANRNPSECEKNVSTRASFPRASQSEYSDEDGTKFELK